MSQEERSGSRHWNQDQETVAADGRGLYATPQMLEAARLKPGDNILDIAAGTGDLGRQAARLVGPEGSVLSADISAEALTVAAELAQKEGLGNITTRVMNAEQLDLAEHSFDAVISRLGLMLISRKKLALSEIHRVLKPGGRLAGLVWSAPERNPLFALYVSRVTAKELEQTDSFSLADPTQFARVLTEAGFRQVQVQAIPLTYYFPSFEALTNWWGPDYDEALAKLEREPRQYIEEEVRQAVRQFERPQGIVAPGELLLGVGMK